MGCPSKYSPEFRHNAVEFVRNSGESMRRIAADLGLSQETLRGWVNQDPIDRGEGKRGELTTAERRPFVASRRCARSGKMWKRRNALGGIRLRRENA